MPFGTFLDAAMSIPRNMQMEEDRNQRQQHDWGAMQYQQDFNSAQAAIQRDWTAQMSNTQYQRAATDASAAGLNRILAMRQGGASSGAGSSASSMASGSSGTPGSASSDFANSPLNSLNRAQTTSEVQRSYNISADTEAKKQQTNLTMEQLETQKHLTNQAKATAETATSSAKGAKLEGEIDDTTYGAIMRYIDRSIRAVTGAGSAHRNFEGSR